MKIKHLGFMVLLAPLIMPSCPCNPCKHPGMSLTPATLVFPAQLVSPNAPAGTAQSVTVKSTGSGEALTINSITASGDYSQTNDCPASLAVGATCTIQVTFAPNAIGNINGAITVASNAGNHTVNLSGPGVPPVGFSLTSLDFGNKAVGSSASQTVTLTNNQSGNLNISSISASGDYLLSNTCSASLAAQDTCTIQVTLKPTVTGSIPGALSVVTDAVPDAQPVGLTGSGTGSVNTLLSFSPASLDFGNQEAGTASAQQSITVTNTSNASSVTVNTVNSSGSNYPETDTCAGQSLAPGGACTIKVKFQPTANFVPVSYPGAVTVTSGSIAQVIGLSGSAVAPVSPSPDPITYPTVQIGFGPPTQTVTLTNNDSVAETVSVASVGNFTVSSNTCAASMNAGSQCTLGVDWNGGSGGPSAGALNITASGGGFLSPQVVNLSACSTYAVVSPQSLNFGDVTVGAASEAATISVFNSDPSSPLNISGATITGANASNFTITNNTCGSSVAVGGSCDIEVKLTPSASGPRVAVFNLADDNFCSPQQTALTGGSGAGPFTVSVIDVLTFFNGTYQSSGTITSTPAGINCGTSGSVCSASFAAVTSVTLNVTPNPGLNLIAWGGACSGSGACVLNMTADRQVSATFSLPQVQVATAGTGTGTVTSSPTGITCGSGGSSCSASFAPETSVTLTATADSGFGFLGWSGACSGTDPCTLTMTQNESVTATFNPFLTLSVSATGTGTGTVTSSPGGITCGSGGNTCSAGFVGGSVVTLNATPDQGDGFSGWSGACSGSNPSCSVTMTAAEATTATFAPPDYSISPAQASMTMQRGAQGSDTININPANGYFGSAIQLTCSVAGPSPSPGCSILPSSVTPGGVVATSTLTIGATNLSSRLRSNGRDRHGLGLYALFLPFSLLSVVVAGRGKTRRRFAIWGLLLLGVILQIACGGGGSSSQPETFTVTVKAVSGAISHSTQVMVRVQ